MLLRVSAQPVDLLIYAAFVARHSAGYQVLFSSSQTTPTPTPSLHVSVPASWNPAIIAAVIGGAAALAAALLAMGVAIYQTRQNRKIEREKVELQLRHDQELERYRREMDVQYHEKEQEKQREDAARHEMFVAQNNVTRAAAYRKALHVDPQISRLQILDMQRPLEVANIYVRVRVHEDTVVRYAIDSALATAVQQRDPDSFFQAKHHYLEQRILTAVDPDAVIRKYRRCVVVGDPGAGKTTLLKYLVLALADGKYPDLADLPIHVELNAFVSSEERDVLDYAAHRWEERYTIRFPRWKPGTIWIPCSGMGRQFCCSMPWMKPLWESSQHKPMHHIKKHGKPSCVSLLAIPWPVSL